MNKWRDLVKTVMKIQTPQNAGNLLTSWGPVSFSRSRLLHGVRNWEQTQELNPR